MSEKDASLTERRISLREQGKAGPDVSQIDMKAKGRKTYARKKCPALQEEKN